MTDISNIALRFLPTEPAHGHPAAGPVPADRPALDPPANNPPDSASFSELGQLLGAAADQPGVRHAKVAELRALLEERGEPLYAFGLGGEALEREGLIHSRRGKGFFVSELSEETKKEMAKGRLAENLEPQLKAAMAEGLSRADISDVLSSILNNSERAGK